MRLAILTPFEGKGWVLDRWLAALRAAALPEDTVLLWLCNAIGDAGFSLRLQEATVSLPAILWHDATRIEDVTPIIAKDSTVARLWRELRLRLPEDVTHVLCLEDDVIIGPATIGDLLTLSTDGMMVVGAPVPLRGEAYPADWLPAAVDWLSFGCTLFPRMLFDAISLRAGKDQAPPIRGYDNWAGDEIRALGARLIAAFTVRVQHLARPSMVARAGLPVSAESEKRKRVHGRNESYAHHAWRGQ